MQWFKFKLIAGALARAALTLALALMPRASASLIAQSSLALTVEDSTGSAIPSAAVADSAGKLLGHTAPDGKLTIPCIIPCTLQISAPGFTAATLQLAAATIIRLIPAANAERISVTAYRTPLGSLESPVTTRLLTQTALNTTATISLEGKLRQLPGVELFRRSSALVANPSSQGISLRGLGSTSASRTLLTQDDVPLNDAFAGTIHWLEPPELAIERIELVRGGASDLYGSSAIGGVLNLVPTRPASGQPNAEFRTSYGTEGTYDDSLLAQAKHGHWGLLASGGFLGTDGFIQEAPSQRGPVDIASNVHSQNGILLAEHDRDALRLFARASGFNEARSNGTPYQTNGTRLWRYATGADWRAPHQGTLVARFYGSTDHFRQTFSSISNASTLANPACAYRCGETPSKFSLTPYNELGAVAYWSQPLTAGLLLIAGADTHDARVWDQEQSYGSSTALTNLHDHQRDSAAYAESMWVRKAWTLTASARMDWFQNFDGHELLWNGTNWGANPAQPAQFGQHFFDPRVGLSRKFSDHWAVSASGFRAFREPTPNELYRSTQVGNQLTKPNSSLLSERATGWETGMAAEYRWGAIRTSYFLTQVNRPITAVTTNSSSSPILLMRENLGQIESRGVSIDYELAPQRWLAIDGGYQYARATVTRGSQDLGNWIPEVARNLATMNVRAFRPNLGTLNLQGRLGGRQFDDDANVYQLHGYFRLDAFASHDFGKRLQLFAAGENLLNRQIEVAKTPTTTLGSPRGMHAGLMIRLGRERN